MKKLLSVLTSICLTGVAATSVVACSVPSTKVNVNFTGGNNLKYDAANDSYKFNGVSYSKSELATALNGNAAVYNQMMPNWKVGMSFDELNSQLLGLLTFNSSLVVKTQQDDKQLRDFRNNYLGRDENEVTKDSYKDIATVDGNKFRNMDSNDYYSKYQKTKINSLVGLQDLYETGKDPKQYEKFGEGAKASYEVAKTIFEGDNKDAANELMKNFANSKKNPGFSNISYSTDLVEYKSQSRVVEGINKVHSNEGLDFAGETQDYTANNNGLSSDDVKDLDTKKIQDKANADPYGVLLLPTDNTEFKIDSLAQTDVKKSDNKTLKQVFVDGDKNDGKIYTMQTQDGSKFDYGANFGEYLVKKAEPLKVTYHFESDLDHSAQSYKDVKKGSEGFNISFTVNNLAEVFSPITTSVKGNTITKAEVKDGKATLHFSDKDELGKFEISVNGKKVDSKKSGDDALVVDAKDGDVITYTDGDTAKMQYKLVDGTSEYSTVQVAWIFRGYKFLDISNVKDLDNEEVTDLQKDGMPKIDTELNSEITHNLRDIYTSGWTIAKGHEPITTDKSDNK